jgi:hypothetical protein
MQMIREMEIIDAKKTAELQKVIASKNATSAVSGADKYNSRSQSSRERGRTT